MTNLFRLGILGFRDFLYDTGQISSKFPERLLYDTTFLRQLDPALVLLEDIVSQNITIIEKNGIYYREDFTFETGELPLKILLVDDSRYVRASLTKAVSYIDGEVIGEATTGIEAIDMFTFLHPNVVTMDLTMPDMSGIRAVKIILQIDPNVIIIVISGTDHQEVREEVFNLGVKMFITKPFDPEQVAAILKNTLSVS